MKQEKATFAAGCFWGVESAFMTIPGVLNTRVGYIGGTVKNPTYTKVCAGTTGHQEAVEVLYDPDQVSYERLLEVFWSIHNPTARDRQGADVGEQYRSVIFYHTDTQRDQAEHAKEVLDASGKYTGRIVTDIVPSTVFYEAESYHQQYLKKNGALCKVRSTGV